MVDLVWHVILQLCKIVLYDGSHYLLCRFCGWNIRQNEWTMALFSIANPACKKHLFIRKKYTYMYIHSTNTKTVLQEIIGFLKKIYLDILCFSMVDQVYLNCIFEKKVFPTWETVWCFYSAMHTIYLCLCVVWMDSVQQSKLSYKESSSSFNQVKNRQVPHFMWDLIMLLNKNPTKWETCSV